MRYMKKNLRMKATLHINKNEFIIISDFHCYFIGKPETSNRDNTVPSECCHKDILARASIQFPFYPLKVLFSQKWKVIKIWIVESFCLTVQLFFLIIFFTQWWLPFALLFIVFLFWYLFHVFLCERGKCFIFMYVRISCMLLEQRLQTL